MGSRISWEKSTCLRCRATTRFSPVDTWPHCPQPWILNRGLHRCGSFLESKASLKHYEVILASSRKKLRVIGGAVEGRAICHPSWEKGQQAQKDTDERYGLDRPNALIVCGFSPNHYSAVAGFRFQAYELIVQGVVFSRPGAGYRPGELSIVVRHPRTKADVSATTRRVREIQRESLETINCRLQTSTLPCISTTSAGRSPGNTGYQFTTLASRLRRLFEWRRHASKCSNIDAFSANKVEEVPAGSGELDRFKCHWLLATR